jgi:tRNA threonylcarbamoyladenosine biosynthesis protein TsaB
MKILSIDTATTTGSVAVTDGATLLAETTIARKETHSIHLMGMIDQTLELAGIDIHQIEGFAYTKGPGSFTGLRIGLSVIKGLAFINEKPIVGISSLRALAFQAVDDACLICALIDARNKEVYCAKYRWHESALVSILSPQSLGPQQLVAGINESCFLIGDGAVRYQETILDTLGEKAKFASSYQNIIHAATIGTLSVPYFEKGQVEDVMTVTPFYIRKSYAEEKRKSGGL